MKSKTKKLLLFLIVMCMFFVNIAPVQTQAAVKLSETRKTLEIGQSLLLKVKGTSQKVKWSSDDTDVASVNKSGKVTAKGEGTATIIAKVAKKNLICKITVKYPEIKAGKTIVYKDKNVSISFTGIHGYVLGYAIDLEIENLSSRYDSSGKLVDSQKAEYVQVVKGIPVNAYVESERNDISSVKAVISDVRKGNTKNHPEKISFTNRNGTKSGVSAQINNIGEENFRDIRLSCVFLKNGNPVGCSVEYVERIPKKSHSFVTFDVPKQEKHLKDSDGDWYWDYVAIDCDQYAILIDYAYYE